MKYVLLVPGLVIACWAMLQIVKRPFIGIMIMVVSTIVFDHYLMGPDSMFWQPNVYHNFNVSLGIPKMVFNPPEVMLLLLSIGWLSLAATGRTPGRPLLVVSMLSIVWFVCVAFAAIWGMQNGGNPKIGLWILRPVFYFLATGFLTYQLVRTEREVLYLTWAIIGSVTLKALGTIWIWKQHRHEHDMEWECFVSHEDTSFCLYVLWLALGAFFVGSTRRMTMALYAAAPLILAAVVFNDRRINFVTFAIGSAIVIAAMPWGALIRRGLYLAGAGLAGLLYIGVAIATPENSLTRPVKGIISGLNAEVEGQNTDSSSQYRKLERFDLIHTVRAFPIVGAGLGVRYLQPIPLPKLNFDYMVYIPHNQVLGTHALMGPVAYFVLLLFYLSAYTQLLSFYRRLDKPWHKLLALAAAASIVNWIVVGYYDMQLYFFRNSIFMGVVIALPACLLRYRDEQARTGLEDVRPQAVGA